MSLILTEAELIELTGYKIATMQINELRRQGFYRARMGRRGVVLERGHYDAIVAGQDAAPVAKKINLPSLRLA
ncbi:DUF4224 domain-containing protein [Variovorax paradoxus]|nr:DUF4224 domain-containing protein [Variovorax paradoxus]